MALKTPPRSDKRKWEPCLIVNNEGTKFNCWGYKTVSPHLMVTPMMATTEERMKDRWVVTHIPTGRMVYGTPIPLDDPQIIIDLANKLAVVEGLEWGFIDTNFITLHSELFQPVRDIINEFTCGEDNEEENEDDAFDDNEFDPNGNPVRVNNDVPISGDDMLN